MRINLLKLALLAVLCTGWAIAQQPSSTMPDQSQSTQATQTTPGQVPSQNPQGQYPPSSTQPGQSSTQTSSGMNTSSDIQTQIQKAFQQDPSLANTGITVNVTDDKVKLSGKAASNAEKDRAHSIAESNAGGRKVDDKVKVSGSETSSPSTTAPPPPKY